MYNRFSSETPIDNGDSQLPQSRGENEGDNIEIDFTETKTVRNDTLQDKTVRNDTLQDKTVRNDTLQDKTVRNDTLKDKEPEAPMKKRSRVSKQKLKSKKKGGAKLKSNPTDLAESSDEEEGNKRGPNWSEHWILNLIHLRGTMHDKFSGIKKQGVDNWGVLHTQLVAACPDFNRSSNACRKKWKKIYDDYKANYTANGISVNDRSSKCKYYSLIDGYMHKRANVFKHVHASAHDEDPKSLQPEGQEHLGNNVRVPEPTASSSQVHVRKRTDKLAIEQAIAVMAEQAVKLTDIVRDSEAAKLNLLQGMLAVMNELVKKL